MNNSDELNQKIAKLLMKDARQSSQELADQLDISSATVRRRIQGLIESGALRIVALPDPVKLGYPLMAIIAFKAEHNKLDKIQEVLKSKREVLWFTVTTGRYDLLCMGCFTSNENLSDFLKEAAGCEGIKDSETFVCLHMEWWQPDQGGLLNKC